MIPVLSVENMRAADKATIENKTSGIELMGRAAKGIYDAVNERGKWGKTLIVCGHGNNAGDGFALGEILCDEQVECVIFLLSERFSQDGRYFFERCVERNIPIATETPEMSQFDVIVDCIFGTGFKNKVEEPYKSVIEKINMSGAYIVSADINSGLNGESGRYGKDSICVHSDLTVSIGNYKPGLYLADAKDVIKEKTNCDIGIKPLEKPFFVLEHVDVAKVFGNRKNNSHKGTYGYIALIGGSIKYSGAIRLANMAQSAMRSGVGVVKLAVPESICAAVMPHLLESTLFPLEDRNGEIVFNKQQIDELIKGVNCVAVGMGIGNTEETFKIVEYLLLNFEGILIIDADGLNALAGKTKLLLQSKAKRIILTPHPKEFARISGTEMGEVLDAPCHHAKKFAKNFNSIVLLKGACTVISDGENVYFCDRGCKGMATAGSGDVLSGVVAAMASYCDDSLLATAAASYVTGLAGEHASKAESMVTMVASDTVLHIKNAINEIVYANVEK